MELQHRQWCELVSHNRQRDRIVLGEEENYALRQERSSRARAEELKNAIDEHISRHFQEEP